MTISSTIAAIGENPYWVAGNAHFWFAAFILHEVPNPILLGVVLVAAAVKEFYFDAKYETDPPQTALDNWTDFAGYAAGAVFGYFV